MLAKHQQFIGFVPGTFMEDVTVNDVKLPDAYFFIFNTPAILKANEPLPQLAAE